MLGVECKFALCPIDSFRGYHKSKNYWNEVLGDCNTEHDNVEYKGEL